MEVGNGSIIFSQLIQCLRYLYFIVGILRIRFLIWYIKFDDPRYLRKRTVVAKYHVQGTHYF